MFNCCPGGYIASGESRDSFTSRCPVQAGKYEEMIEKIDEIRSLDYAQPESQQKIRKFAFGDLADGNVRKRVKHIVHEMI